MAKQPKSEGRQVREAYDGPKVEHDDLIGQIEARAREEHERSSDASESAAKVSAFLEETGLNSQAFGWLKTILKKLPKKDGQAKAMDIIRSLYVGLPILENHVAGQGTNEMNLGEPEPQPEPEPDVEPDVETLIKDGDPDLAEDAADFDAAAANVVKPIDFASARR